MKTKITKFAAAAVIIIGVAIGINYSGMSVDGSSVAWASIAERVQQSKAIIYHMVMISERAMTAEDQAMDMPDMDMEMDCHIIMPIIGSLGLMRIHAITDGLT